MSTEDEMVSGLGSLHARVGKLESGFAEMKREMSENTTLTRQVASDTSDLVEFAKAAAWIGKMAKPISYLAAIGASLAGVWVAFKTGVGMK